MSQRYPLLYRILRILGLAAILVGLNSSGWSEDWVLAGVVTAILMVGMPHGATDYLIFKHLTRPFWGTRSLRLFYIRYILLMAAYGLVWWLAPSIALALFLLFSMYHFGQSNWHYARSMPTGLATFTYMVWGAFVVLAPVAGHYPETAPIIGKLIGGEAPELPGTLRYGLLGGLLGINLWLPYSLKRRGFISRRALRDEWINLGLLAAVFAATPGLVGFTIYFVGWHSLTSILDQVAFFREARGTYSLRDYVRATLPLTAVALLGLALLAGVQHLLGMGLGIGALFMFISIVTLPHMILLDRLYHELGQKDHPGHDLII